MPGRFAVPIGRGEFFSGLFILAFANGVSDRISKAVADGAFLRALLNTFDISVIVWAACWTALCLLARPPAERVTGADLLVGAGIAILALVPFGPLSWIALSGLGLHVRRCADPGSPRRRAGTILLALTVPMFWSRLLFAAFSGPILRIDATLASFIIGTDRVGNTIRFADDWGYLFIGPPCSSIANVSLAVLCWVLFAQCLGGGRSLGKAGWGLTACVAVVAINVTRIGLIGLDHRYFDLLHGPVGATAASWLTLAAIAGFNMCGYRREIFRRT